MLMYSMLMSFLCPPAQVLPYELLMSQLDIGSVRSLEDFLIDAAFYAGILGGKLDQKEGRLLVHHSISRDVRAEEVPDIVAALDRW